MPKTNEAVRVVMASSRCGSQDPAGSQNQRSGAAQSLRFSADTSWTEEISEANPPAAGLERLSGPREVAESRQLHPSVASFAVMSRNSAGVSSKIYYISHGARPGRCR